MGSTKLSVNGKTVVLTGTVTGMERKDVEAKLQKVLLPNQFDRLKQIDLQSRVQREGAAVLTSGELADQLGHERLLEPPLVLSDRHRSHGIAPQCCTSGVHRGSRCYPDAT